MVVLLVLLVDLEPKAWHISGQNLNAIPHASFCNRRKFLGVAIEKILLTKNLRLFYVDSLATVALSHGKERIVNKFRK